MTHDDYLELVSPMAPAPDATETSSSHRAKVWTDVSGARVSIVDNGKHNALELLEALRSLLVKDHGALPSITIQKEVSGPIHGPDLAQLAAASDVVLVGTAD